MSLALFLQLLAAAVRACALAAAVGAAMLLQPLAEASAHLLAVLQVLLVLLVLLEVV